MPGFDVFKATGIKKYGDAGAWVYDEWKKLNATFFHGKNKIGEIIWGKAPQNRNMGYYLVDENLICLNKSLMRPIYPTGGLRWEIHRMNKKIASDVLLHEMIHQTVHQSGGWVGETSHNNEKFVGEINRIAKLLGLNIKARVLDEKIINNRIRRVDKTGYLSYNELYDFPYSSRPNNYYYMHP